MVDQKDIKILKELKNNSKLSAREISKKTRIAVTTIFNRIKKMERSKIIKGYTAIVDDGKLGRNVVAYIMVTVDYNYLKKAKMSQQELAMKLKQHEFVDEIGILTGVSDIIIKIRTADLLQLNEFVTKDIRNIEGVEKTQTSIVLESF